MASGAHESDVLLRNLEDAVRECAAKGLKREKYEPVIMAIQQILLKGIQRPMRITGRPSPEAVLLPFLLLLDGELLSQTDRVRHESVACRTWICAALGQGARCFARLEALPATDLEKFYQMQSPLRKPMFVRSMLRLLEMPAVAAAPIPVVATDPVVAVTASQAPAVAVAVAVAAVSPPVDLTSSIVEFDTDDPLVVKATKKKHKKKTTHATEHHKADDAAAAGAASASSSSPVDAKASNPEHAKPQDPPTEDPHAVPAQPEPTPTVIPQPTVPDPSVALPASPVEAVLDPPAPAAVVEPPSPPQPEPVAEPVSVPVAVAAPCVVESDPALPAVDAVSPAVTSPVAEQQQQHVAEPVPAVLSPPPAPHVEAPHAAPVEPAAHEPAVHDAAERVAPAPPAHAVPAEPARAPSPDPEPPILVVIRGSGEEATARVVTPVPDVAEQGVAADTISLATVDTVLDLATDDEEDGEDHSRLSPSHLHSIDPPHVALAMPLAPTQQQQQQHPWSDPLPPPAGSSYAEIFRRNLGQPIFAGMQPPRNPRVAEETPVPLVSLPELEPELPVTASAVQSGRVDLSQALLDAMRVSDVLPPTHAAPGQPAHRGLDGRYPSHLERETERIWENQRRLPFSSSYSASMLLPSDRAAYSTEDGSESRDINAPPPPGWEWETDWTVEMMYNPADNGWIYARTFIHLFCSWTTTPGTGYLVRRRCLKRTRVHTTSANWVPIDGALAVPQQQRTIVQTVVAPIRAVTRPVTKATKSFARKVTDLASSMVGGDDDENGDEDGAAAAAAEGDGVNVSSDVVLDTTTAGDSEDGDEWVTLELNRDNITELRQLLFVPMRVVDFVVDQHSRCARCEHPVPPVDPANPTEFVHRCAFTGQWFCEECFGDHLAVVPSQLLATGEAIPVRVSSRALHFLTLIRAEPLFCETDWAPTAGLPKLAKAIERTLRLRELRRKLVMSIDGDATVAGKVARELGSRAYFADTVGMLSLQDLIDLCDSRPGKALRTRVIRATALCSRK